MDNEFKAIIVLLASALGIIVFCCLYMARIEHKEAMEAFRNGYTVVPGSFDKVYYKGE